MEETKKKNTKIKSETEYVQEERAAQAASDAEDTVKMTIFPDGDDGPFKCTINGVDYEYEKGVEVNVPKHVAVLIRQTMAAKKQLAKFTKANEYRNAGVL